MLDRSDPRVVNAAIEAEIALHNLMSIIIRDEWDPDHSGPEDICDACVEWLIVFAETMARNWPELRERDASSP